MIRKLILTMGVLLAMHCACGSAYATGATLVFKSGIRIFINNGYEKIVDAFSRIDADARHKIVSLDVEGGIFLLDVAEVVVVCKEQCSSISLEDMRDPSRGR